MQKRSVLTAPHPRQTDFHDSLPVIIMSMLCPRCAIVSRPWRIKHR